LSRIFIGYHSLPHLWFAAPVLQRRLSLPPSPPPPRRSASAGPLPSLVRWPPLASLPAGSGGARAVCRGLCSATPSPFPHQRQCDLALGTTSAGEGCRIGASRREIGCWKLPAWAADMVCGARPHLDLILNPLIHFHPFPSASWRQRRFACSGDGNGCEGLRRRPGLRGP
jgi:hypothetical protein